MLFRSILKKSPLEIQRNWGSFSALQKWNMSTHYNGFGFQLHFYHNIRTPDKWCWSCESDWSIIVLPASNWLYNQSKNDNIKTVWSCVVIDMNSKSKRIGKTLNECDIHEALSECVLQLKTQFCDMPSPDKVTISNNLQKINKQWVSNNTGFTKNNQNYLPMKGNMTNLFAVGCFNDTGHEQISSMKKAIESSCVYLQKYEPYIKNAFYNNSNYEYNSFICAFIIIIGIYLYKFYKT